MKRGWIGVVLLRGVGDTEDQIRKVQEEKDDTTSRFLTTWVGARMVY